MRVLPKLGFLVLAAGMALAQSGGDGGGQGQNSSVADELKALREAISEQQKQISQQQQQMSQQQQQMSQQQQQIQTLQQQLQEKTSGTPRVADAALHNTAVPAITATNTKAVVQET
ncbi:MAG TPA: hypothetical protein VFR24_02295, partial [Candidatus Angelobacter sp.]|nr:hypothetical protein [Candidatus Angelobacter sp.]